MAKKQIGPRVSSLVLKDFLKVCRSEGLSLGEAVQVLMEKANKLGSINELRMAVEAYDKRLHESNCLALEVEATRLENCLRKDRERLRQGRGPSDYWNPKQSIEKIIVLLSKRALVC